jgi:serine/threonine protein kinase
MSSARHVSTSIDVPIEPQVSTMRVIDDDSNMLFCKHATMDEFKVCRRAINSMIEVQKIDTGETFWLHRRLSNSTVTYFDHPFIMNPRYVLHTEHKLYPIFERFTPEAPCTLIKLNNSLSIEQIKLYAAEMLLAIEYLHRIGIKNLQLTSDHTVLDQEGHMMLNDFDLGIEESEHDHLRATTCRVGDAMSEYTPPEVLIGRGQTKACHWWFLGLVIYEMYHRLPAFYRSDYYEMMTAIQKAEPVYNDDQIPADLKSLLTGLLQKDPMLRLGGGPDDAEEIKAHIFFIDINWDDVMKRKLKPSVMIQEDPQTFAEELYIYL